MKIDTRLWIFRTVLYVEQLGAKKIKHLQKLNAMKFLLREEGLFIPNVFLLPLDVRDVFWFLDIYGNDL